MNPWQNLWRSKLPICCRWSGTPKWNFVPCSVANLFGITCPWDDNDGWCWGHVEAEWNWKKNAQLCLPSMWMWIICSMLYGPTNTGSYVKVTGIVVDLGVHDAPDLHLGLHWQRRLSFQEKQVRFCGKSNQKKDFIQVKPLNQISKRIPNPTIPSSFPLLHIFIPFVFFPISSKFNNHFISGNRSYCIYSICIYIYSIFCFFQFLPKSTANFWFPKTKTSLPFLSGNPCPSTWPCPTASSGAGRSRRRNGIPRCRSEVATAAARVAAQWQLGVKPWPLVNHLCCGLWVLQLWSWILGVSTNVWKGRVEVELTWRFWEIWRHEVYFFGRFFWSRLINPHFSPKTGMCC